MKLGYFHVKWRPFCSQEVQDDYMDASQLAKIVNLPLQVVNRITGQYLDFYLIRLSKQ